MTMKARVAFTTVKVAPSPQRPDVEWRTGVVGVASVLTGLSWPVQSDDDRASNVILFLGKILHHHIFSTNASTTLGESSPRKVPNKVRYLECQHAV